MTASNELLNIERTLTANHQIFIKEHKTFNENSIQAEKATEALKVNIDTAEKAIWLLTQRTTKSEDATNTLKWTTKSINAATAEGTRFSATNQQSLEQLRKDIVDDTQIHLDNMENSFERETQEYFA